MGEKLSQVVHLEQFTLVDEVFRSSCRTALDYDGLLVLPDFLTDGALCAVHEESKAKQDLAYFCVQQLNVYLMPTEPGIAADQPRNRNVVSSKVCITDDQVAPDSKVRALHDARQFRRFLCAVLNEAALYEYANPLSSINIHYATEGQQLGWHFDKSSFAITLLIQEPGAGGEFEYIRAVRDSGEVEMNFAAATRSTW